MFKVKSYRFHLGLSSNQYLDYYRGRARNVVAPCADGLRLQFPAALLKRFITPQGIHGKFELICDDNNKVIELRRI